MKRIFPAQAIAFLAAALISGSPLAQETDEVMVQASGVEMAEAGRTASGLPVWTLSVTHEVSFADLDLASTAGMAELKSRVREAAWHGCHEIGLAYRFAQPSDWNCARLATKDAMTRVQELVAAN